MGKKSTLDEPPPGPGVVTVTDAVPGVAMAAAGTAAVSCELLTNVVWSDTPFQLTTEVEAKPVPFTVSVTPGSPGAALVGTGGWFSNGTGLDCAWARAPASSKT